MYDALDAKKIGSRIRAVRLSKSMSQAELAAKASLSLPLISNIELGKTSMQLETFIKIAEALQISTDHLLRPDIPEVRAIYQGELSDIMDGCTPNEMESILKIVRELKNTFSNRSEY